MVPPALPLPVYEQIPSGIYDEDIPDTRWKEIHIVLEKGDKGACWIHVGGKDGKHFLGVEVYFHFL